MITTSKTITKHFHSTEFRCKHCGTIKIDERLVNNMEKIFDKLNASKCIISSGYRCSVHDKAVGGNGTGQHTKGYAADCIYYDKNGKIIPSKIVVCVAYDSDLFRGIAKIDNNYTHLDIRTSGYYKGDETVSFNSVWSDPYSYFKVTKEDMAKYTGETITPPIVYKTVSNCYWLNLRTSPMYGSNIYKAVKVGTKVEYLGVANGWARIKYENKTLYCGLNYLK